MANIITTIDRTKPQGNDLLAVLNQIYQNRAILKRHLAQMANMHDGVTFATVESVYGLPAGKASDMITTLTDAITKLESANVEKMLTTFIPLA